MHMHICTGCSVGENQSIFQPWTMRENKLRWISIWCHKQNFSLLTSFVVFLMFVSFCLFFIFDWHIYVFFPNFACHSYVYFLLLLHIIKFFSVFSLTLFWFSLYLIRIYSSIKQFKKQISQDKSKVSMYYNGIGL